MDDLKIVAHDARHALGQYRSVQIALWPDAPMLAAAEGARRAALDLHRSYPRGGLLWIVPPARVTSEMPDGPARAALARLLHECGTFSGLGFVVEATGFGGAAVRGVLAGILLAARSSVPSKVFATVDEATAWLCARLDAAGAGCGTPAALRAAAEAVRGALG